MVHSLVVAAKLDVFEHAGLYRRQERSWPISSPAAQPPKLLLVEDDEVLTELLRYNLEADGFAVLATDDGSIALELAEGEGVAAVIVDWSMPKLSGVEVCRRLRLNPGSRHLPILMLTAKDSEADRRCGLANGADLFVTKPCSIADLVAKLRDLIATAATD